MTRNLITIGVLIILAAAGYYLWVDGKNMLGGGGDGPVACTADAKLCPDGSAVGRVGPDCYFAPCPGDENRTPYESPVFEVSGTSGFHFTLSYPNGWSVDEGYQYSLLGPDSPGIPGVKFIVPESMATGTNLSADTGISVEYLFGKTECTAEYFLYEPAELHMTSEWGNTYSVASMAGAGAGNRYEEQVWALSGSQPCVALRYYTHSTVVENYPPGTVTEFDKNALMQKFDEVRRTLNIVNQ